MATGLTVAFTVLVVLAVVAAAGYLIDMSAPDERGDEVPPPQRTATLP